MQNIIVTRYENPQAVGYRASIAPEDQKWCLFVDADSKPSLYVEQDLELAPGKITRHMVHVGGA